MGSKKFKDKLCAYCAAATAETADHVFCREFFPVEYRDGLPKAPACSACNGDKAKLERYLTAVLPFGSDHPAALGGQREAVERRLAKNQELRRELAEGSEVVWVRTSTGLLVPTRGLPFDGAKFNEYLRLAIRGLVWHESNSVVPSDYVVEAFTWDPETYDLFCSTVLSLGARSRVSRVYADGALRYSTGCAPGDAALSTWQIWLYENLGISAPSEDGQNRRMEAVGITGPPSIKTAVDRILESAVDA